MNIKTISNKNGKAVFVLSSTDVTFVNTVRRLVVDEVLTMAIDTVDIKKNDSALYDEMLALRLGLVSLTTDLQSYKQRDLCTCEGEGCLSCEVKLTLKKTGPCVVYASDIVSADPKVKPAYDKTIITKLFDGQEIDVVAIATLGKGKQHAKHSAGYMHYKYLPKITAKKDVDLDKLQKEIKIDIISNGKIDDHKVMLANLDGLADIFKEGTLNLNESDKDFVVTVESYGQLSPKDVLIQAANELQLKLNELEKQML
ncbi:MAG: DNA-directed RNA polymerase subunit D [Candidatus Woesearchaeota archaeon]|jgi:DNA-directed RNA polymerase subunit D